jgi:hypothetical protein
MLETTFFATLTHGENKYLEYPCRVLVTNGEHYNGDFSWCVVRVAKEDGVYSAPVNVTNPILSNRRAITKSALLLVTAASEAISDCNADIGEALSGTYVLRKEDVDSLQQMLKDKPQKEHP